MCILCVCVCVQVHQEKKSSCTSAWNTCVIKRTQSILPSSSSISSAHFKRSLSHSPPQSRGGGVWSEWCDYVRGSVPGNEEKTVGCVVPSSPHRRRKWWWWKLCGNTIASKPVSYPPLPCARSLLCHCTCSDAHFSSRKHIHVRSGMKEPAWAFERKRRRRTATTSITKAKRTVPPPK